MFRVTGTIRSGELVSLSTLPTLDEIRTLLNELGIPVRQQDYLLNPVRLPTQSRAYPLRSAELIYFTHLD